MGTAQNLSKDERKNNLNNGPYYVFEKGIEVTKEEMADIKDKTKQLSR